MPQSRSHRIEKVEERVRREVSRIFFEEIDFGESLVTVTRVAVPPDVRQASVFLSVIPGGAESSMLERVRKSAGRIQGLLKRRLPMRPVPRLRFLADEASRQLAGVDRALEAVRQAPRAKHGTRRSIRTNS